MLREETRTALKVLVTGSRGKSSVVRYLHAAMQSAGIETWARITGIEPRELGPRGARTILRSAGAHVEEMRWWLKGLPRSAEAIVLENSAVTPDLQGLAARWLQPTLTVFTNAVPDHQEAWGSHPDAAARALCEGVPRGGKIVLPEGLLKDSLLNSLLADRSCELIHAAPASGAARSHEAVNQGLALEVLSQLGLETEAALQAMQALPASRHDFRVVERDGVSMAMAFAANDLASTRALFDSLGWAEADTRLVYNHRVDRPGRFRSFRGWIANGGWRDVALIGDRPPGRLGGLRFHHVSNANQLQQLFDRGDRVFACGNMAGLPHSLY